MYLFEPFDDSFSAEDVQSFLDQIKETDNASKFLQQDKNITMELQAALETAKSQKGTLIDQWIKNPTVFALLDEIRNVSFNASRVVSQKSYDELMLDLSAQNGDMVSAFIQTLYTSDTAASLISDLPKEQIELRDVSIDYATIFSELAEDGQRRRLQSADND